MARIKWNRRAFRELLRSQAVIDELARRGEKISDAAGGEARGIEVQRWVGKNRGRITVRTATPAARVREARDRTLLRSLDAGRDR